MLGLTEPSGTPVRAFFSSCLLDMANRQTVDLLVVRKRVIYQRTRQPTLNTGDGLAWMCKQ